MIAHLIHNFLEIEKSPLSLFSLNFDLFIQYIWKTKTAAFLFN